MASANVTDSIQGIGIGTKFLLETMDRIYGERFQEKIRLGIMVVNAKTPGKKRPTPTMVLDGNTLTVVVHCICRRVSRRHLLGLRAVFARARNATTTKAAVVSDSVASALAELAVQMERRRRRPIMRRSSVGGSFDRLHSAWTHEGVAVYLEYLSVEMLEQTTEKKGLS
jgi:hypothetical protein